MIELLEQAREAVLTWQYEDALDDLENVEYELRELDLQTPFEKEALNLVQASIKAYRVRHYRGMEVYGIMALEVMTLEQTGNYIYDDTKIEECIADIMVVAKLSPLGSVQSREVRQTLKTMNIALRHAIIEEHTRRFPDTELQD